MRKNAVFSNLKIRANLALTAFAMIIMAGAFGLDVRPAHANCSATAIAGVDWQDCRKRNLIMTDFDFTGSNFERTDFSSSDLRNTTLDKSNFTKTNLFRASLRGATAKSANFTSTIGLRTDFSQGDFTGSTFQKADIARANFEGSILNDVDMSKGELSRASFAEAKLSGVKFDFSNLGRSDFRSASLAGDISMKGSFLFLTHIEGVDLSMVQGLEPWQLEMACGDGDTKLPAGMDRPDTWPCSLEES